MKKKKSMLRFALILSTFITFVSTVTTFIVGNRVYKKTFKVTPHEIGARKRVHERRLQKLDEYEHQKFMVDNPKNGYPIETIQIQSPIRNEDVIVIVHGIQGSYYDLLEVAFRYLDDGKNIIMYNQRQSGLTGGTNSTFGLYERFDLEAVCKIAKQAYPNGKIGVHGFSMGAATATMHSELNEKSQLVDFYILDSPFHTMASAVDMGVNHGKDTKLPNWFVKFSGSIVLKLRERVTYKDIVPIKSIKHTTKPILFMHGEQDNVTAPKSSFELCKAINHKNKRLKIFKEQDHCTAYFRKTDEYFTEIYSFIEEFFPADSKK